MAAGDFHVPTVDISAFLRDANCAEAQKIVDDVREACMTTGFFQIVGHGVPRSLQEAVFKGAEALFSLPLEVKKKLDKTSADQASNRGYEVIGNQSLQAGGVPDLKEVSCFVFFLLFLSHINPPSSLFVSDISKGVLRRQGHFP